MLKLIHNVSKTHQSLPGNHNNEHTPLNELSPTTFLSHYKEISSNLCIFRFHGLHHDLSCEMILELKSNFVPSEKKGKKDHFVLVLTGGFPDIDIQRLQRKVPWDDYLYVALVIRFHLKILEQLLLFCKERDVTNLFLRFGEDNLDYMEVFRHFYSFEAQVLTPKGEQTEIVIPTNSETYNELFNFMGRLGHDFRQNLWRDQKINPAYRQYLKYLSLPEF